MTIRFHDVSHHQGAYKPTGPTFAKATEGSTFVDPEYAGIRSRTLAGGWPFLAYHFLAHGNIDAQVSHVIATIGNGRPLMLDVESEPNLPNPTLGDVLGFADAYVKASGGGRVTLAYIPAWYWSGHMHSPSLSGLTTRRIGLISSDYTTYSDTGVGWNKYGGVPPAIWQYTSTPLDTNAFKGTADQLAALMTGDDMDLTTANLQAIADELLARDNGITAFTGVPASAGKTVSLRTWLNTMSAKAVAQDAAIAAIAAKVGTITPAALAAAVVASLPPASAGGLTEAQVEQAVHDGLSKLHLTVAP